jgi:hypothetical protein
MDEWRPVKIIASPVELFLIPKKYIASETHTVYRGFRPAGSDLVIGRHEVRGRGIFHLVSGRPNV